MGKHLHDVGAHGRPLSAGPAARPVRAGANRYGFALMSALLLIAVLGTIFAFVVDCIMARTEVFRRAKERQYAVIAEKSAWQEYRCCLLGNEFLPPGDRVDCSIAGRWAVGDLEFSLAATPVEDRSAGGPVVIATDVALRPARLKRP